MKEENIKTFLNELPPDMKTYLFEEFINPQLKCDELIKNFHDIMPLALIQDTDYLSNLIKKIIDNKSAFKILYDTNAFKFKDVYEEHFIKNKITFDFLNCPYESMVFELIMLN